MSNSKDETYKELCIDDNPIDEIFRAISLLPGSQVKFVLKFKDKEQCNALLLDKNFDGYDMNGKLINPTLTFEKVTNFDNAIDCVIKYRKSIDSNRFIVSRRNIPEIISLYKFTGDEMKIYPMPENISVLEFFDNL